MVKDNIIEREDRRIQRTRRLLSGAMLALIVEQPYDSISVRDIAERADVNRATFYHHFDSKEALLGYALEAQFDALVASIDALPEGDPTIFDYDADVLIYQHIAEHADLYRVILGEQGLGQIIFRTTQYIAKVCEAYLREGAAAQGTRIPVEIIAQHMAGSMVGLVRWWLLNGMPNAAEEMARITHELCVDGVLSCINGLVTAQDQAAN